MSIPIPPPAPGPPDSSRWLEGWRAAATIPVLYSDDPHVWWLLEAFWLQNPVAIRYWGGSEPGAVRTVVPRGVFRRSGYVGLWCEAWCERRSALRTFRCDLMQRAEDPSATPWGPGPAPDSDPAR